MGEEVALLALNANVPMALAELVAAEAANAHVSLKVFRRDGRPKHLTPHKRHLVSEARKQGYSWPQIARAVNRDISTCIYNCRMAEAG